MYDSTETTENICELRRRWRAVQHRLRAWELENAAGPDDQRAEDERRALADEAEALAAAIAAAEPRDWRELADLADQLADVLAEPWAGAAGEPDPEAARLLAMTHAMRRGLRALAPAGR
ncbi:MAG: hypothetical protein Kow00133_15860 [Amphiplicatus sp.]